LITRSAFLFSRSSHSFLRTWAELKVAATLMHAGATGATATCLLDADEHLVRMYSAVARQLPVTDTWDLSSLLIDGQPVSRSTVVAWLNAAYQNTFDRDFEQQDDSPGSSAEGLYQLLAFADAINSSRPLIRGCCEDLERLQLRVQLGQQQVSLKTQGTSYAFSMSGELLQVTDGTVTRPSMFPAARAEQQAMWEQVAAQTEQLLWLAYKLQLEPLLQQLHRFVRGSTRITDAVFSARVLDAAGVAGLQDGKEMLQNSVVGEVALLNKDSNAQTLLEPVGLSAKQQKPLCFDAVVQRTGLNLREGATVPVELDLFGQSTIKLGPLKYPVQLRIGSYAPPRQSYSS
jgi:hypothetical protein